MTCTRKLIDIEDVKHNKFNNMYILKKILPLLDSIDIVVERKLIRDIAQ